MISGLNIKNDNTVKNFLQQNTERLKVKYDENNTISNRSLLRGKRKKIL